MSNADTRKPLLIRNLAKPEKQFTSIGWREAEKPHKDGEPARER